MSFRTLYPTEMIPMKEHETLCGHSAGVGTSTANTERTGSRTSTYRFGGDTIWPRTDHYLSETVSKLSVPLRQGLFVGGQTALTVAVVRRASM